VGTVSPGSNRSKIFTCMAKNLRNIKEIRNQSAHGKTDLRDGRKLYQDVTSQPDQGETIGKQITLLLKWQWLAVRESLSLRVIKSASSAWWRNFVPSSCP
jgi:hypothetical protein